MAAAGGHWAKLRLQEGTAGVLIFVPKGLTIEEAIAGQKAKGGGFPESLDGIQVVKGLGGSTGAKLVQDKNGNLYVMKKGANEGHLLEEAAADAAYKALGVNVPESRIYQTPSGAVKLAKYVEGKALSDLGGNDASKLTNEIRKGFAADALLGNWDVVGLAKDNVMLGANGKAYRIDNGGSLRYRAMGALKTTFSKFPDEIFTLRNPGRNSQAASVFGKLTLKDIAGQIPAIRSRAASLIKTMPAPLKGVMNSRLNRLYQAGNIHKTLSGAGHSENTISSYIQKLWTGLGNGKISFDPSTSADILKSFSMIGG